MLYPRWKIFTACNIQNRIKIIFDLIFVPLLSSTFILDELGPTQLRGFRHWEHLSTDRCSSPSVPPACWCSAWRPSRCWVLLNFHVLGSYSELLVNIQFSLWPSYPEFWKEIAIGFSFVPQLMQTFFLWVISLCWVCSSSRSSSVILSFCDWFRDITLVQSVLILLMRGFLRITLLESSSIVACVCLRKVEFILES